MDGLFLSGMAVGALVGSLATLFILFIISCCVLSSNEDRKEE